MSLALSYIKLLFLTNICTCNQVEHASGDQGAGSSSTNSDRTSARDVCTGCSKLNFIQFLSIVSVQFGVIFAIKM